MTLPRNNRLRRKLEEVALTNPIVHFWLQGYEANQYSWDESLVLMALSLAESNDIQQQQLLDMYKYMPARPLEEPSS